jgi:NAD(P)-dependent dehydrogenase (short-subunit alcohol dehydrogenase family)
MGVCLVTGAEKGIGRALALALHERGESVIAVCLNDSDELRQMGLQVEPNIDVTRSAPLRALAERLNAAGTKIDVLISNAGIFRVVDTLGDIDYEEMRAHFEINALGHLRVTEALMECLNENAKVGLITSRFGSLAENTSGRCYAYRVSKAAANMVGINLWHDLKKRGQTVVMLHPGMVATDMSAGSTGDFIQPEEAAAGLVRQLDAAKLEDQPEFRHANDQLLPW